MLASRTLRRVARVVGLDAPVMSASSSSSAASAATAVSDTPPGSSDEGLPVVRRRDDSEGPLNKVRGFIEYERNPESYRDASVRLKDWMEINTDGHEPLERKRQAARCMDCGTPFCQTHTGCPINNLIPEWNQLVFTDQWEEAIQRLHKTNNFPEFTGRVCPAPCEGSCVAGLIDKPVTIKNMEYSIINRAWKEGWIKAHPPQQRTGHAVAVVGSGPAGLAAADELNKVGHSVTVFERAPVPGGLLTYGIPNMKLDKDTVKRRLDLMVDEGVTFECGVEVGPGADRDTSDLRASFDAVVLATGATVPRDLPIPGRDLDGIHFAMDFLTASQQALFDRGFDDDAAFGDGTEGAHPGIISARGKRVVVIGGGDTGTDCIGTSIRHGCTDVINLELLPQPPAARGAANPWPEWPRVFKVDYGHSEGVAAFGKDPRQYSVMSKEFLSDGSGRVTALRLVNVEERMDGEGRSTFTEVPDTVRDVPVDMVLLAMGFVSPEQHIVDELAMATDARDNIYSDHGDYRTFSRTDGAVLDGVFVAGDCRRGQSLVVWAINEGRGAAARVHAYLS